MQEVMFKMNYAKIKYPDISNGRGVRVSLFVSGCRRKCKGCFNPEAWDFDYGEPFDEKAKNKIKSLLSLPHVTGLSVLGGEPLDVQNWKTVKDFLMEIREQFPKKTIWLYTGYTYENVIKRCKELPLLADVVVDGEFIEALADKSLAFRGSRNQRIISMAKS